VSEPIPSAVTIDVEDVMKHEHVCSVFRFQHKDEDYGFVALRLQFFTGNPAYNLQRKEKLAVMEKELGICFKKAMRGSMSASIS
jgi:hypothetical protein